MSDNIHSHLSIYKFDIVFQIGKCMPIKQILKYQAFARIFHSLNIFKMAYCFAFAAYITQKDFKAFNASLKMLFVLDNDTSANSPSFYIADFIINVTQLRFIRDFVYR